MGRLVLFMHTSLDGFVAGPNGEMGWIQVNEEMFDEAGRQTARSGTALYGRVTYQMMDAYWPTAGNGPNASKHDIEHSNWYNQVPKVVVSKTLAGTEIPNATVVSDDLAAKIAELKQHTESDIVMFGSPTTAHALVQANLIDDYKLFVNPIVLGQGIPLFKHVGHAIKLVLVTTNVFSSGVAMLHYQLK